MKTILLIFSLIPSLLFAQSNDNWTLNANSNENYSAPTMANGMIGLVASSKPMQIEQIILNGVFDKYGNDEVQCILAGINFANIEIQTANAKSTEAHQIKNWKQQLHMKRAVLSTQFDLGDDLKVSHHIYALRQLPHSALFEIELEATEDTEVKIINKHQAKTPLKKGMGEFRTLNKNHIQIPVMTSSANSPKGKHQISAASGFMFNNNNQQVLYNEWSEDFCQQYFTLTLKKGEKFSFSMIGSTVTTAHFQDHQTEAERQCIFAMLEGKDKLIQKHENAWEDIWETDIIIEGDDASQKDLRFAMFNLFSSIRENTSYSIPPMGLTSLGYYGHIFWDSELWMYPPLLVLNPELAKPMIDYRIHHLKAAKTKASTYGYEGIMYPWESDDIGEESTPTWALTGPFEHHITAVVGLALWDYYAITQDKTWLKTNAYPILNDIADFWISRSTQDENGKYHILNVVGADEYAENVDNNAFTNGAVITLMNRILEAARILDKPINPQWESLANGLVIEKFEDGTVKNYKGYSGQQTKQADVNLLSFPLQLITEKTEMLKNLNYYQGKVDDSGPAMTHSIYSIIYSKLGMKDEAWELFQKAYKPNQRPPYGVLAEGAYDNNPYFMTAAGGMLQSVLFGFCGAEITNEGIIFNKSQLPKHWKSVTIKGFGTHKESLKITN